MFHRTSTIDKNNSTVNRVFNDSKAEITALTQFIAGISYEVLKISSKYQKFFLIRLLVFPGLFLQKITTKEPDAAQIETAIKALKAVL